MEFLSVQTIFKPRNLIVAGIVLVACLLAGGYYVYENRCENQSITTSPLFSGKRFSSEELICAEIAFANEKLGNYTLKDGAIHVPTKERDRYILALKNTEVLATPDKSKTSSCSSSFWESEKQREEKSLREKQEKLATVIRTFHGIETADVLLDTMELKTGFRQERINSASITVRSVPNYVLSESDLQAIANLALGAICGLKPENLTIVDTRTNQSWRHPVSVSTSNSNSNETVTTSQKVTFAIPSASGPQPFQSSHDTALEMLQPRRSPVLAQAETELESPQLEDPKITEPTQKPDVTPEYTKASIDLTKWWVVAGIGLAALMLVPVLVCLMRSKKKHVSHSQVVRTTKHEVKPEVTEHAPENNALQSVSEPEDPFPTEPEPESVAAKLPEITLVTAKLPEVQNVPETQILPEILALEEIENEKLVRVLSAERPQTITLILAQFCDEKRDNILRLLPENLSTQISERIPRCESPDPEILREVANSVLENIAELQEIPEVVESAPEPLINSVTSTTDAVFSQMRAVRFDDLQFMTPPELRAILEVSPPPVAVMAMIGAPPELVDKMLGILSRPEAEKVRKVLENPGKVRLSDVEKARRKLAEIASSI